jgi:hypothetical protein
VTIHFVTANLDGLNTGTGDTTLEAQGVVITDTIDMRYQSDDSTCNGGGNQVVDISGGVLGTIDDYSGATSGNDSITITQTGYVDHWDSGAIMLAGGGNTIVNEGSIAAAGDGTAIYIYGADVGVDQLYADTIRNTGVISGSAAVGQSSGAGVISISAESRCRDSK